MLTTGTLVVFIKCIKSPTWEMSLTNFFFFYKSCFVMLLYFTNLWAMLWYLNGCLVCWMLFKNTMYIGENKFSDITSVAQLEQEVLKGTDSWVLLFYSELNTECIGTMSLWCNLSINYATKSLKFGKVCIDDCTLLTKKCGVDTSPYSKQLPSLILYSQGKESRRFPPVNSSGEVGMVINYKIKEIIKFLGIDRIHLATRDT